MINNNIYPKIILIEPQLGENIGSSARAMLNFGLNDLVLVNPRDGWPNKKAISTSAGAIEHSDFKIQIINNIEEAIKDSSYIVSTSARKRDINKPIVSVTNAVKKIIELQNNGIKTAILFGGEQSGLSNNDLVKSDTIIKIDTNNNFSSINLSMSVFAFCHQWYIEDSKKRIKPKSIKDKDFPAKKNELIFFLDRLINKLEKNKFFIPKEKKNSMISNIEAIFTRNNLTSQELRILHGIISNLITVELEDDS